MSLLYKYGSSWMITVKVMMNRFVRRSYLVHLPNQPNALTVNVNYITKFLF